MLRNKKDTKDEESNKRKYIETENYWNQFCIEQQKKVLQEMKASTIASTKFEETVNQLYNMFVQKNGLIFSFHSASHPYLKVNAERIFYLFELKRLFDKKEMILEDILSDIQSRFDDTPYFVLQVEMEKVYAEYTPGKGLCWIISENQAYYRGKHMIENQDFALNIETWLQYTKPLDKLLEEAYSLMKEQAKDNYSEGGKLDNVESITAKHNFFIEEWENVELRKELIATGEYKKTLIRNSKELKDRWGSNCGFGTIFFSGKGSLEESPPLNYFMNNKATLSKDQRFHNTYCRENYAMLSMILPFNPVYHSDRETPLSRSFCGKEIKAAMRHNNSILYSGEHFQPIDWPETKSERINTANECLLELTKKTVDILTTDWTYVKKEIVLQDVEDCLKKIIGLDTTCSCDLINLTDG